MKEQAIGHLSQDWIKENQTLLDQLQQYLYQHGTQSSQMFNKIKLPSGHTFDFQFQYVNSCFLRELRLIPSSIELEYLQRLLEQGHTLIELQARAERLRHLTPQECSHWVTYTQIIASGWMKYLSLPEQIRFYGRAIQWGIDYQHWHETLYYGFHLAQQVSGSNQESLNLTVQAFQELIELSIKTYYLVQLYCDQWETLATPEAKYDEWQNIVGQLDRLQLQRQPALLTACYVQLQPIIKTLTSLCLEQWEASSRQGMAAMEAALRKFDALFSPLIRHQQFASAYQSYKYLIEIIYQSLPQDIQYLTQLQTLQQREQHCFRQLSQSLPADGPLYFLPADSHLQPKGEGQWVSYRDQLAKLRAPLLSLAPKNDIAPLLQVYTQGLRAFFKKIVSDLVKFLGKPPCGFTVFCVGSASREDASLFSDVDAGLWMTDARYRQDPYFKHLICLWQLTLKGLDDPWITPRGGQLQAIGLQLDEGKLYSVNGLALDYINEPEAMAIWAIGSFTPQLNPAYGLYWPVELYNSDITVDLLQRYQMAWITESQAFADSLNMPAEQGVKALARANSKLHRTEFGAQAERWRFRTVFDLKKHFLAPFTHPCLDLALYYAYRDSEGHLLNVVPAIFEQLEKNKVLIPDFVKSLHQTWQFLQWLRLSLQQQRQGQPDSVANPPSKITLPNADTVFELKQLPVLSTLVYQQLCHIEDCVLIPFYASLEALLDPQRQEALDPPLYYLKSALQDSPVSTDKKQAALRAWLLTLKDRQAVLADYELVYRMLSEDDRAYVIDFMNEQMPGEAITNALAAIPDTVGYRQAERLAYQRLHQDLVGLTLHESMDVLPQVIISWIDEQGSLWERSLNPKLTEKVIELATGQLQQHCTHSRHRVAAVDYEGHALHIKALPDQPLMDYAIDILYRRLIGQGTPANRLARLSVKHTNYQVSYPVLISQTIGKTNLRTLLKQKHRLKLNFKNYCEHALVAAVIGSGDASSRNYIVSDEDEEQTLYRIDNEQTFVEPIVKKINFKGFNKVQYQEILFCLAEAKYPLSKDVLASFLRDQNIYNTISHWVRAVQACEKNYIMLYGDEKERRQLYTQSEDYRTVIRFLLREGTLGELLINLNYLASVIKLALEENKIPTALDILTVINPRLGHYYRSAFNQSADPEKRFITATDAPQASISSSLAIKASLGVVPCFEDIEVENKYSLNEARKEMQCLLDFKPDFSKLIDIQGKPDIHRQHLILKSLSMYPHKQLSLSHCAVLDDNFLKLVLEKSVQLNELDLRHCPQLTHKSISYLAGQHVHLKKLYLNDNPGIQVIAADLFFTKTFLQFPNLEVLHISRCENLTSLSIKAPNLHEFKEIGCSRLKDKQMIAPKIKTPLQEYSFLSTKQHSPYIRVRIKV